MASESDSRLDLALTCLGGDCATIQRFVDEGGSVTAADKYGNTPLHWASMAGTVAVIPLLVELKASLEARNNYGETPVLRAWNFESFKLLIELGANVDIVTNEGETLFARVQDTKDPFWCQLLINRMPFLGDVYTITRNGRRSEYAETFYDIRDAVLLLDREYSTIIPIENPEAPTWTEFRRLLKAIHTLPSSDQARFAKLFKLDDIFEHFKIMGLQ